MSSDGSRYGSAREEAERLVAAGLAAASMALHGVEANRQLRGLAEQVFSSDRVHDLAAGLAGFVGGAGGDHSHGSAGGHGYASAGGHGYGSAGDGHARLSNGSADCCVCPVCRLIAALRNPSPEFAERLASAAGDLAVGISGFLRVLSGAVPRPGHDGDDDPWRAATTATPPAAPDESTTQESESAPTPAPQPAPAPGAKKTAAKKTAAKKTAAKKTAARKAAPNQATAEKAAPNQATVKKAAAKKAVAKKAVRKAVPGAADDSPHK